MNQEIKYSSLAIAAALLTGSAHAGALTVTTYTSKASFNSAAGATVTDMLDDAAEQVAFGLLDRGDYTIDPVGGPWEPMLSIEDPSDPSNVNGTRFLEFGILGATPGNDGRFVFDAPITAFGFDYNNIDTTDELLLAIDGQIFTAAGTSSSGFFGITTDGGFTEVRLVSPDFKDFEYAGIDNITYTPEPTSLALLGLGGLLIARRRR